MDDIDIGKIGKRDEKLVGWDHIRKPIPHTLPPMKARGRKISILDRLRSLWSGIFQKKKK